MKFFGGSEKTQSLPAQTASANDAFTMSALQGTESRTTPPVIFHQDHNNDISSCSFYFYSLKSSAAKMDPTRCVSASTTSKNLKLFRLIFGSVVVSNRGDIV